ncbi:vesicle coat component [Plenodomus lindquistii]|nr:vesicle coat component [Plenodomus lindquistii]
MATRPPARSEAAASEGSASWNPALRHDKDVPPAPTTQPPIAPAAESSDEDDDEDYDDEEESDEESSDEDSQEESDVDDSLLESLRPAPPAPPAPPSQSTFAEEITADHDSIAQSSTSKPPESIPLPSPPPAIQGGATPSQDDALVAATNALDLKEPSSEEEESEDGSSDESSEEEGEGPAEHYEHQGDTSALDEAMTDSGKAPLVADTEADEWGASGEALDFAQEIQATPLETPMAKAAVGTTVGDDVIGISSVGGNAGEDIDWGNTEEQEDFFASAANRIVEPAQDQDVTPGAHVVDAGTFSTTKDEWDLDLDLDDEFLPETDEAPVFELSDDDGFLEDDTTNAVPQPAQPTTPGLSGASRYAPQAAQPSPTTNPYAPISPQLATTAQTQQRSPVAPAYNGFGQNSAYQQQPSRPAMPSSAQSFVDKSKGGYASPYDLPDDIVTTRKRPAPRTAVTASPALPPPRTSSMSSTAGPPRPLPASNMSAASLSPPPSGQSMQSMTGLSAAAPTKPAPPTKSPSSDFFAELPVTSKPRPSGRYTPQPSNTVQQPNHPPVHHPAPPPVQHAPPQFPPKERTPSWSSLRNEVHPDPGPSAPPLRQPEQLPMFPTQPSVPTRTNSLPVPQLTPAPPSARYSPAPPSALPSANSRYSPAPPNAPASNARYSPAPPSGAQGQSHARYVSEPHSTLTRTPSQPFAPRTSSPLAYHSVQQQQDNGPDNNYTPTHHVTQSADGVPRPPFRSPLGEVSELEEADAGLSSRPPTGTTRRSETPPLRSSPSSAAGSPMKRGIYTPTYPPATMPEQHHSITQSPTANFKQPSRTLSATEPSNSAYGFMPPIATHSVQSLASGTANHIPHRRQASLNYDCIVPEDERASDPLQRWKGYPVFTWGLGGTVVTSFPKQIPRYGGGASAPMMKCSPGEIQLHSVKDLFPLQEDIAKFPGPLKSKSKKKEVLVWLGRRIEALEMQLKEPTLEHSSTQDEIKRLEDRALLWKVLSTLVEHDGRLEGAAAETTVKKLLAPEDPNATDAEPSYSTAADIVGRSRSNTANLQAEPTDPRAIEDLQNMLIKGDREKAVWHAVDQRLWGHAMLLSSTLSKDIWKQVVQEFVRKEVKKVGQSNQALAVLYEVFAGNHEDCIDELVPASARAGFQMVSADGAGATQNALQGLDKWRQTVALIMNNRSEGDAAALLSLGRLLAHYNRIEAAHTCFLFARSVLNISGVDDAQADLVLISADHRKNPLELGIDLEPILLTEVFEFAMSLSLPGGTHILPHLQNYKLAHAYQLAEYGYRTEAQSYCDAIAAAMKATTRISPYYSASFIASLDDLSKRLSQSPKDGSSSWISKPSMDKVGSSLLSKFNSFIAGDAEDAATNDQGAGEAGPFAKIAGDSPGLTSPRSNADLYGAYAGFAVPAQPTPGNSKYAPSNIYSPRTSSEQQRSRYEPGGRPSLDSTDGTGMRAVSEGYMPSTPGLGPYSPTQNQLSPPRMLAKTQSYSPLRTEQNVAQASYGSPYMPSPPVGESASTPALSFLQPAASFDDPAPPTEGQSYGGYEPPSSTFEAPSYQPYNPDEDDQQEQSLSKKKSFMDNDDDDDDLAKRASALKISGGKSEADKKADEAFRKAAEADAQRDKDGGGKKAGWFGGWFKKDPAAAPGPIKAKLGEENSFVYDPELKKWVNKKGGATETSKPAGTPPPPRGGPSGPRSASGGAAPPMGPPSGPLRPPTSNPGVQRSSSMPPPMVLPGSRASTPGVPDAGSDAEGPPKPPMLARPSFGAASGPPSRPGTSMSNASSIDDLLGAPQARKGPGAKKKKGGRYVDVMAQGS